MSDDIRSTLEHPPPRPAAAVAPHVRKAARGYRTLGWIIVGAVLVVALMVGGSSAEGKRLSTGIYAFLGAGAVLILPTWIFVRVNTRHIREALTAGVPIQAKVIQERRRGETGRQVDEIEVEVRDASGAPRRAFVSGVAAGASPGTELTALMAPHRPTIVALVLDDDTVAIARIAPPDRS